MKKTIQIMVIIFLAILIILAILVTGFVIYDKFCKKNQPRCPQASLENMKDYAKRHFSDYDLKPKEVSATISTGTHNVYVSMVIDNYQIHKWNKTAVFDTNGIGKIQIGNFDEILEKHPHLSELIENAKQTCCFNLSFQLQATVSDGEKNIPCEPLDTTIEICMQVVIAPADSTEIIHKYVSEYLKEKEKADSCCYEIASLQVYYTSLCRDKRCNIDIPDPDSFEFFTISDPSNHTMFFKDKQWFGIIHNDSLVMSYRENCDDPTSDEIVKGYREFCPVSLQSGNELKIKFTNLNNEVSSQFEADTINVKYSYLIFEKDSTIQDQTIRIIFFMKSEFEDVTYDGNKFTFSKNYQMGTD